MGCIQSCKPHGVNCSTHLRHHLAWPVQRKDVGDVVCLVLRPHMWAACPAGHLSSKRRAAHLSMQLTHLTAVEGVLTNLQQQQQQKKKQQQPRQLQRHHQTGTCQTALAALPSR